MSNAPYFCIFIIIYADKAYKKSAPPRDYTSYLHITPMRGSVQADWQ